MTSKEREPVYLNNVRPAVRPDFTQGRCYTRVSGSSVVDAYAKPSHPGRTTNHRAMCEACPIKQECGAWALKAEMPAGDWGGMYGGMTAAERRRERAK